MQAANATPLGNGAEPTRIVDSAPRKAPAFRTFGSLEFKTNGGRYAKQWSGLLKKVSAEQKRYDSCETGDARCHSKVRAWRKAVRKFRDFKGYDTLAAVNSKVNKLIAYADDIDQFGRADYWASPIESLSGRGDCEDYAIVKYFMLAELGVPEDQMRIVIVEDTKRKIGHAVLAVKLKGKTYILDSLRDRPRLHTAIKRYRPFFSLNRKGAWVNVAARKRSQRVAAMKPQRQTPAQAQAMLPDYAKNQGKSRNVVLRGSLAHLSTVQ